MASGQTSNFGLSQWEPGDQVLREDFNGDNTKIDGVLAELMPSGAIVLWSGAADAVPTGWVLCDGQHRTPDLRGRFIQGAGGDYVPGDIGGTAVETLTSFTRTSGSTLGAIYAYAETTHDNRPPYYALCFIMKN